MAETGVLLDGRGAPLAPAIAWHDARGGDEARRSADEIGERRFIRTTGLPVTALCSAPKLRWLDDQPARRRAPRAAGSTSASGSCAGSAATRSTELSLASRTGLLDLDARRRRSATSSPGPACATTSSPSASSPGRPPAAPATRSPAREGAVLTVAGHDHLAAGVGVGVVAPGDVLDSCGTAEALVRVVAPPLDADAIERVVEAGPSVGWHVADGRQAILDGLWSGLALQGGPRRARHRRRGPRRARRGRDRHRSRRRARARARLPRARAPAAAPARRRRRPSAIWRATLDEAAALVDRQLARVDAVAGARRRLVVTGGWARDEAVLAAKRRLGADRDPGRRRGRLPRRRPPRRRRRRPLREHRRAAPDPRPRRKDRLTWPSPSSRPAAS